MIFFNSFPNWNWVKEENFWLVTLYFLYLNIIINLKKVMEAVIKKYKSGYGLKIPKSIISQMSIAEDTEVKIDFKDNKLIITTLDNSYYELNEILKEININNIHSEISTGAAVGNELC